MHWHYILSGEQTGPITEQEFEQLVKAGTISNQTLVWREGFENWIFYGDLLANETTDRETPQDDNNAFCCECHQCFPVDNLIPYEELYVCANCKNIFFQRLREGAPIPGRMCFGGFWIRFGAKFIDGIILSIFNQIVQVAIMFGMASTITEDPFMNMIIMIGNIFVQLGFGVAYYTFFVGRFGATPGKMACKLKVIRSDGSSLTYGRACLRYFAEILSQIILYIGYIMVAFDDQKRALHDRLCDTRVIRI